MNKIILMYIYVIMKDVKGNGIDLIYATIRRLSRGSEENREYHSKNSLYQDQNVKSGSREIKSLDRDVL
jgi:hypothetical protein